MVGSGTRIPKLVVGGRDKVRVERSRSGRGREREEGRRRWDRVESCSSASMARKVRCLVWERDKYCVIGSG